MKKSAAYVAGFLLVFIVSTGFSKDLWEKYLSRMEQFSPPPMDLQLFLDILKERHGNSEETSPEQLNSLLEKGLNDSEDIIRKGSAVYIARKGIRGFSKEIVEKVKNAQSPDEKKLYIWVFGEAGESDEVLALVQYFQSENQPYLLNLLTAAIGKIAQKDGSMTPLLLLAENSRHLFVKSTAILGLGKVGDPRAFSVLWNLATESPLKEIRFCAILSLSTVLKEKSDFAAELAELKNRFTFAESHYEKLALAYTIQKLSGFDEGYYQYLTGLLKTPVFSEVSLDLLEDLPYPQGKDRLEIVVINYPKSYMKQRIQNLISRLKGQAYASPVKRPY